MMLLTGLSLGYIHMQMQIFDLAYQGKDNEKKIDQLVQEKEYLSYEILSLKSAENLGIEMLDDESDMQFVDPSDIMHISATETIKSDDPPNGDDPSNSAKGSLLSLLSFTTRAEAKDQ